MFNRLLCFGDSFCAQTDTGSYIDNLRLELNPNMSIAHIGLPGSTPVKTFLEIQDFDILPTDLVIVTFSYSCRILDSENNPLPGFPNASIEEWKKQKPKMQKLYPDVDLNFIHKYYLYMYNDARQDAVASCIRLGVNKILSDIGCTYVCLEVSEDFKNYDHGDNAISFPGLALESLAEYDKESESDGHIFLNHMNRKNNFDLYRKILGAINEKHRSNSA